MQLRIVASLWYYQLRLLLNTQLTDRKQEVYRKQLAVSDRSVLQGRDSVAHHWSHRDQQKEVDVREESHLLCFFLSFSPLHNKK